MQLEENGHASEDSLESYVLGALDEPQLGEIEEHLLLCSRCQERLKEMDAYHAAMRSATAQLEAEDESRKRFFTRVSSALAIRRLGWILAMGAVIVLGLSIRVWMNREAPAPVAVLLETSRGSEVQHAPARRPLALSLDTTALATYPSYEVETVDAVGRVEARLTAEASQGRVRVSVRQGLGAGRYFIRLYSPSHELLREYGLVVD